MIPTIKFNKAPITATTRRIKSKYTLESKADITSMYGSKHGIDFADLIRYHGWCKVHGYKSDLLPDEDPVLYKKYKIDTLLKPEDGGEDYLDKFLQE